MICIRFPLDFVVVEAPRQLTLHDSSPYRRSIDRLVDLPSVLCVSVTFEISNGKNDRKPFDKRFLIFLLRHVTASNYPPILRL